MAWRCPRPTASCRTVTLTANPKPDCEPDVQQAKLPIVSANETYFDKCGLEAT